MNKRKIDIDSMFAQLREESKPTPLRHLVEPRASGALFALKQSVSASLTSAKLLWIGVGCALAVGAGALYTVNTNTARQHEHIPAAVAVQQTPAGLETPVDAALPETNNESSSISADMASAVPPARTQEVHNSTGNFGTSHSGGTMATRTGNRASGTADNKDARKDEVVSANSGSDNADIAQAQYLHDASYGSYENMRLTNSGLFSLPEPVEQFPLMQSYGDRNNVSLTMNGMALLADIVQVQSELRLSDRISCGVLLGVGNVAGREADTSHRIFLAGAQVNYYVLGDFEEGLQIGAQALFSSTDIGAKNTFLYENGRVLSIIPYAGYKFITASGLTLNLQAGVGAATPVFIPAAAAATTTGDSNTEYKWHVATRIQLNMGWSL